MLRLPPWSAREEEQDGGNRGCRHPPHIPWINDHVELFDPNIHVHICSRVAPLEFEECRILVDGHWAIQNMLTRHLWNMELAKEDAKTRIT